MPKSCHKFGTGRSKVFNKKSSAYIDANLVGFGNILELCKEIEIENFIYASSSSVYGGNKKVPFDENDSVDHPVSLYAATKKLMKQWLILTVIYLKFHYCIKVFYCLWPMG